MYRQRRDQYARRVNDTENKGKALAANCRLIIILGRSMAWLGVIMIENDDKKVSDTEVSD